MGLDRSPLSPKLGTPVWIDVTPGSVFASELKGTDREKRRKESRAICFGQMASVSNPQRPQAPMNSLYLAANLGSTELLADLLSEKSIDIDQQTEEGDTPLMVAAFRGHLRVVRILLDKEADVTITADGGLTALLWSAKAGHVAVSKMLVNAGADLEAATYQSKRTPLHLAAREGHGDVTSMLIEAGADLNCRGRGEETPLFFAVQKRHMNIVKMLLRAKANPLLTGRNPASGKMCIPLDLAAHNGYSEVVHEMVQQVGIEGCGGASGGVDALEQAATNQHLDTMAVLTDAGVVDDGVCLAGAVAHGRELSVQFLLRQRKGDEAAYANYKDIVGFTPLLYSFGLSGYYSSPRIVRLLVEAGADTTSVIQTRETLGGTISPLAKLTSILGEKKIGGKYVKKEQLHRLEGIRRLLLQAEAVHATSWVWPVDIPSTVRDAESASRTVAVSTSLRMMMLILRRRARRPGVLLTAVWRLVPMPPKIRASYTTLPVLC